MVRKILATAALAFVAALVVPAVPASAGGGCHEGVTEAATDTVELVEACFTPAVVDIAPGGSVTFVNTDPFAHNVTANTWGHFDDLNTGDSFTATFDEPGVYPFACTYHPGMTGAVVVGDGSGAGGAVTTAEQAPSQVVEVQAVQPSSDGDQGSTTGWLAGGAIGLAIGLGVGLIAHRRRSAPSA